LLTIENVVVRYFYKITTFLNLIRKIQLIF